MTESVPDPEVAAMATVNAALEALEGRAARKRVLDWADSRYVNLPIPELPEGFMENFTGAIVQAAQTMNVMPPARLIALAEKGIEAEEAAGAAA